MITEAGPFSDYRAQLTVPISIIAGSGDTIANPLAQSNRLANLVLGRDAQLVAGAGHMVHYFSPGLVIEAATSDEPLPASV